MKKCIACGMHNFIIRKQGLDAVVAKEAAKAMMQELLAWKK